MLDLQNWPWKIEPDYTRLLNAINREGDTSYVPFLEIFADPEFIAAALEEPVVLHKLEDGTREEKEAMLDQKLRFWHRLGYDAFWEGAELTLPELLQLSSNDTANYSRGTRKWADERAGAITNWEEFERYPWPSAMDADYHLMEYMGSQLPEGMGLLARIGGMMEPLMFLMGLETLSYMIYDDPELIQAICDKLTEIHIPIASSLVQMEGVVSLMMGDDMGYKTGTFLAPEHLRTFVFPYQQQMAEIAHNQGIPFILHSCGLLEAVMDDLIEDVKIDAKHSFEDVIEPVESFVARCTDRISAIGGVDVDLLVRGSEKGVRARTREILHACAPSKSYVLGSGNSITNYIPVQNFLAMVDEGRRYNAGR
ncbi:MAG: uroporphyrinogen-III decarboxylase-like protein [Anaerolineales bacterium]|nr:uroporphyrinogen-III decarboxylase-like protein [Anaerolineales bacterium]